MPLANVSPSGAPNNACGGPRAPAPSMRGRRNPCQATEPYQPEPGNKQTCKGLHTTFSLHKKQTLNKQTNKTNETNKTNKQRCHQMIWIGHWSLILPRFATSVQEAGRDHACTPVRHQSSPATPLCAFAGNGPKARGHAPDGSFLAALPSAVGHRHGRGQRLVPLRPTVPDPAEPDGRCS